MEIAVEALRDKSQHVLVDATWTTDAPFREAVEAIDAAKSKGVLAVEMEAAALYAFASSARVQVLCLAHVTNSMGQGGDLKRVKRTERGTRSLFWRTWCLDSGPDPRSR